MNLTERINNDIKEAMKAREKDKLMALRDIKSKLLLEMTKDGSGEVDEARGIAILNKLYKQRLESMEIYKTQGREDLLEEESKQAEVIASYLPEQLSGEKFKFYDMTSILCDFECVFINSSGKLLYWDSSHLTLTGSNLYMPLFRKALLDLKRF